MTKEFNNLEEIQKYYDKKTNTYVFKEDDDEYIDLVIFNFDLEINSNINAYNIIALDINAFNIIAHNINAYNISAININACNISAYDISARNISYGAVCFAYYKIKCKSIKGRRWNHKHFVLDGVLDVEEEI